MNRYDQMRALSHYTRGQLVQLLHNINANFEAVRDEARVGKAARDE